MKGSYKSRWVIVIVVVIAAIAAFWFWQGRNDSRSAAPGVTKQAQQSPAGGRRGMRSGPLAPVQAATAVEQAVPRYLTGLGTITAANTVTVRSRVDGQLIALHFQEGQQVKAGDLLAEIDPSQFKVALAQAQGQLAKDKATLANARRDLARYQQLAKTNLVSRQELDAQQALVSETEGTIKVDEASVASAQLQLDWSRITAPVDGRVGLKQVDVGNQISSGDTTGIVVITQTHPIDLVFTLPESDIATVVQAQKAGKPLVVEAWDRTNSKTFLPRRSHRRAHAAPKPLDEIGWNRARAQKRVGRGTCIGVEGLHRARAPVESDVAHHAEGLAVLGHDGKPHPQHAVVPVDAERLACGPIGGFGNVANRHATVHQVVSLDRHKLVLAAKHPQKVGALHDEADAALLLRMKHEMAHLPDALLPAFSTHDAHAGELSRGDECACHVLLPYGTARFAVRSRTPSAMRAFRCTEAARDEAPPAHPAPLLAFRVPLPFR